MEDGNVFEPVVVINKKELGYQQGPNDLMVTIKYKNGGQLPKQLKGKWHVSAAVSAIKAYKAEQQQAHKNMKESKNASSKGD